MPYEVPPLPYDYSALEPHIDEQTMNLDHEPGLADLELRHAAPRHRRLGARLLPEIPEPQARVPRDLVERRQLGCRSAQVRERGQVIRALALSVSASLPAAFRSTNRCSRPASRSPACRS